MSEQTPGSPREIIQLNAFSQDELHALQGINYESLPKLFSLSLVVYNACREVYNTFAGAKISEKYLIARQRAIDHYLPRAQAGDVNAVRQMMRLSEEPRMEVEFGQQFYRVGNDIAIGSIHRGSTKKILFLRNHLDGLPDVDSVVNIHNHPNKLTFSDGDVVGMLADIDSVPGSCLYFVVEGNGMHLMFPSNETPRINLDSLLKEMDQLTADEYKRVVLPKNERYQAEIEFMKGIAQRYKLGFYTSPNSDVFQKV